MRGDYYIPGALVTAWSLRTVQTKAKIVCMVTEDVSADGKELLARVFDDVVLVPVVTFRCRKLKTLKQQELYETWAADSFTKWRCLELIEYEKVIFIDADKILLANCDDIFELPAPSATFSSPWAYPYSKKMKGITNPYLALNHGDEVPKRCIRIGLENHSFVIIGTMVLLKPDCSSFENFVKFCSRKQPFGYSGSFSMMDEQSLTAFYYETNTPWHFIHQRYNYIPWHRSWLDAADSPKVFHYFGKKIWVLERDAWPDADVWWQLASALVAAQPLTTRAFDEALLARPRVLACAWCESEKCHADVWQSHSLVDERGRVSCPRLAAAMLACPTGAALQLPLLSNMDNVANVANDVAVAAASAASSAVSAGRLPEPVCNSAKAFDADAAGDDEKHAADQ